MLSNRSCDITKIILITLGTCLIIGGFGLLLLSYPASAVGTSSFTFLLAVDEIDPEELSQFRYTQWRKPSKGIRPFIFSPKSFEDCKILRYCRGSRPHWYVWVTYYEAEYMMPDGIKVIGQAFGPLPYVAPNLFFDYPHDISRDCNVHYRNSVEMAGERRKIYGYFSSEFGRKICKY